jgi:hypothetical protein
MKKYIVIFVLGLLCLVSVSCSTPSQTPGEKLFSDAQKMEASDLQKASTLYKQARDVLVKEGKNERANDCRLEWQKIEKITLSYTISEEALSTGLKKAFPKISDEKINSLKTKIDQITTGGQVFYFDGALNTAMGLDPQLMLSNKDLMASYKKISLPMMKMVADTAHKPWQPYTKPVTYMTVGQLNIPRKELPKTGLFKLWIPLPTQTATQINVKVVTIAPEAKIKYPVRTDGDIGMAYLEFPLDQLKDNLKVFIKYQFTHYEQHFLPIDPTKVGEYDKSSPLIKHFTSSSQNIKLTPEIIKTAKEIAGKETNPYLVARKIYEYVVDKITYSLMPHLALDAKRYPEAVYVHEHRYGDCGAQSAYFTALCRAVGIPARTTGGFQMWMMKNGQPGPHFWAEFYLPNYGWVPVDTSAAQIYINMSPFISKAQQQQFKWFFFANQDSARCVIQKDVDTALIPPTTEPISLSMAIQFPTALCDTMDEIPGALINKYWKQTMKIVK